MAVWSVVRLSELEGGMRLDAEYYRPEFRKFARELQKQKSAPLGTVAHITDGQHGYFKLDENSKIRQITAKHIVNGLIEKEQADRLAKETHQKNLRSSLQSGDVLLSSAGTIGLVGYVTDDIPPANIDQDVIRIHVRDERLYPLFLWLYLQTRFGRFQIERITTRQDRGHLSLANARNLQILLINQQRQVCELAETYVKTIQNAKSLFLQAEQLLLDELEWDKAKLNNPRAWTASSRRAQDASRWDAEYFQPKFDRALAHVRKRCPVGPLGELVAMRKGVEPGNEAYQEEGHAFIRVSNLTKHGVDETSMQFLSAEIYNNLAPHFQPKIGEILLSKDATPGIAYVLKKKIEGVISSGILRLKVKKEKEGVVDAEYLALVLNSPIGQMQIERDGGGSVITHWKPEQVKALIVPKLDFKIQQKIASLVRRAHESRGEAKALLEKAKRKVEQLIEGAAQS